MSYAHAGTYFPDPVAVPLDTLVVVPSVPSVSPQPQRVPPGLQVYQWIQMWFLATVSGHAPRLSIYVDWSPTGWALREFTTSTTPALEIDGAGVWKGPDEFGMNGRFCLFRIKGGDANGADTQVSLSVGGW